MFKGQDVAISPESTPELLMAIRVGHLVRDCRYGGRASWDGIAARANLQPQAAGMSAFCTATTVADAQIAVSQRPLTLAG